MQQLGSGGNFFAGLRLKLAGPNPRDRLLSGVTQRISTFAAQWPRFSAQHPRFAAQHPRNFQAIQSYQRITAKKISLGLRGTLRSSFSPLPCGRARHSASSQTASKAWANLFQPKDTGPAPRAELQRRHPGRRSFRQGSAPAAEQRAQWSLSLNGCPRPSGPNTAPTPALGAAKSPPPSARMELAGVWPTPLRSFSIENDSQHPTRSGTGECGPPKRNRPP